MNKLSGPIGVVIIGRNEGARLIRCLESIPHGTPIVYVDSGSSDNSVVNAVSHGAIVVALDTQLPFTAARARNLGWKKLLSAFNDLEYVQFIDGDCYFDDHWFGAAKQFLDDHKEYAVCCGRRQEMYPNASVYNALCDIEWNTPCGDAKSCGGDALIRVSALMRVNGYLDHLIAGEEPEMCIRLRREGFAIRRLDCAMTWHDAAIHYFSQWWQRSVRCGFAYANGVALHGFSPEKHWLKETARALFWGALLPCVIVALAFLDVRSLWLVLVYPLQMLKVFLAAGSIKEIKLQWSFFMVVSKFSECYGILKYLIGRMFRRTSRIIEYK
ncbi:glycosyltransferase family 2 protein [Marinagarivorans algicola]|uniref:glycosyltransferase family 2 protein n=1 Tax=Marinagarivorans algicola TaxID=1513270 RepID=UPI0006B8F063|nr:glycosyltransferase family 2 protein [Marinagarivorans algicola]